jgi:hypothetical protein
VLNTSSIRIHGRSPLYCHSRRGYTKPFIAEGLDAFLGVVVQELLVAVIWADQLRLLALVELVVLSSILAQLNGDVLRPGYAAIRRAAHSPSIR